MCVESAERSNLTRVSRDFFLETLCPAHSPNGLSFPLLAASTHHYTFRPDPAGFACKSPAQLLCPVLLSAPNKNTRKNGLLMGAS